MTVAFCAFTSNLFCKELPSKEISNSAELGTSMSTALKSETEFSDFTDPRENDADPSALMVTEISPVCTPPNVTAPFASFTVNC